MTELTKFRTELQQEREKRDMAVYNEYNQLMSVEGQSLTEVNRFLMKKYNIHSQATIYAIRKRCEAKERSAK